MREIVMTLTDRSSLQPLDVIFNRNIQIALEEFKDNPEAAADVSSPACASQSPACAAPSPAVKQVRIILVLFIWCTHARWAPSTGSVFFQCSI